MPIRVVTDSTADVPNDLAEELGIAVVPLYVNFGDDTFRDGVDMSTDDFYERLVASKVLPTTSQPSAGDFEDVYRKLAEETTEIVSIHLSGKLSGTLGSAATAAAAVPECTIEVIDSRSASLGCGLAAIKAAQAARAGARMHEVLDLVQHVTDHQRVVFTVDTLEYLRRGGRIGRGAAFLGSLLSIKPLLELRDGEIFPVERVRSRKKALNRMYEGLSNLEAISDIGIIHATTPDDADEMRARLEERFPDVRFWTGRIGPVLGAHTGPGILGVLALRRRGEE
ncbi:MAG TPA: DegV family protein [Dehalococcoidia bacterium]|nr:DegV family protein [Dehalococcoidia bacterium]